ncbi:hypothetical protein MHBO_001554, partial [Bonamia ostreae]
MNQILIIASILHGLSFLVAFLMLIFRGNRFPFDKRSKFIALIGMGSCTANGLVIILLNYPNVTPTVTAYVNYILRSVILILINVIYAYRITHVLLDHARQRSIIHNTKFNKMHSHIFVNIRLYFLLFYMILITYPLCRGIDNSRVHQRLDDFKISV